MSLSSPLYAGILIDTAAAFLSSSGSDGIAAQILVRIPVYSFFEFFLDLQNRACPRCFSCASPCLHAGRPRIRLSREFRPWEGGRLIAIAGTATSDSELSPESIGFLLSLRLIQIPGFKAQCAPSPNPSCDREVRDELPAVHSGLCSPRRTYRNARRWRVLLSCSRGRVIIQGHCFSYGHLWFGPEEQQASCRRTREEGRLRCVGPRPLRWCGLVQ